MSGYSRDHYSDPRHQRSSDRNLPPLRDVVGDLNHIGRRPSQPDPYALGGARYPQVQPSGSQDQRGLTLPPIHNNYPSHRDSDYASRSHGHHAGDNRSYPAAQPTSSSYRSRTPAPGGPAAGPSMSRSGYATAPVHDDEPEKRHKCEYCGKKFDRPSSLQVHKRTHTGDQPFVCEWPGCARTFNVRSNMLRHFRSHERHEVNPYPSHGGGGDHSDEEYATGGGSAYYTSQRR